MIATDYEKQAIDFLNEAGVTFEAKLADQTCPNWGECKPSRLNGVIIPHSHGLKYDITLSRKGKSFKIPFWTSQMDSYNADTLKLKSFNQSTLDRVTKAIKPTAYSVLACLSGSIDEHQQTFQEFCDSFGYDTDSIKAKGTYEAICDESRALARFFTSEELDKLRDIN